jgi:hypothetical protein
MAQKLTAEILTATVWDAIQAADPGLARRTDRNDLERELEALLGKLRPAAPATATVRLRRKRWVGSLTAQDGTVLDSADAKRPPRWAFAWRWDNGRWSGEFYNSATATAEQVDKAARKREKDYGLPAGSIVVVPVSGGDAYDQKAEAREKDEKLLRQVAGRISPSSLSTKARVRVAELLDRASGELLDERGRRWSEAVVEQAAGIVGKAYKDPNDKRPSLARASDPDVATCPACFRDIKATSGFMADHGYEIKGRSYYGVGRYSGGYRSGSCRGVGKQPWEVSPKGAEDELAGLEQYNAALVDFLGKLAADEVPQLEVQLTDAERDAMRSGQPRGWNPPRRAMMDRAQAKATPYVDYRKVDRWDQAREGTRRGVTQTLRQLWSRDFGSIPWFRAALRQWKPQDVSPAKGAPYIQKGDYHKLDFVGMPGGL